MRQLGSDHVASGLAPTSAGYSPSGTELSLWTLAGIQGARTGLGWQEGMCPACVPAGGHPWGAVGALLPSPSPGAAAVGGYQQPSATLPPRPRLGSASSESGRESHSGPKPCADATASRVTQNFKPLWRTEPRRLCFLCRQASGWKLGCVAPSQGAPFLQHLIFGVHGL